jgi:hypothetical protein
LAASFCTQSFHLYCGFPMGLIHPRFFPEFILWFFTLTTCPAHCSLLTRVRITGLLSLLYDINMFFSLFLTYFLVLCILNY